MSAGGHGLAHLPYGVFAPAGGAPRVGVRFEDGVLDLAALAADGLLEDPDGAFAQPALNAFMARGPAAWAQTRERVGRLLSGVDAEPAGGGRGAGAGGGLPAGRGPRAAAAPARRGRAAAAVRRRRLRRLLVLDRARVELRADLPARLRPAAAELAAHADRLPRAL